MAAKEISVKKYVVRLSGEERETINTPSPIRRMDRLASGGSDSRMPSAPPRARSSKPPCIS